MQHKRKSIIINEINYWKKNRLLPEQYCDYLLALYTEGNQPKEDRKVVNGKMLKSVNLLFLLLIPMSVFLLYFTELSIILQTAFAILFIFLGATLFFYFSKKEIILHIPIITSTLIYLFFSVEIVTVYFPNQSLPLYMNLISNCLIWVLLGWKWRLIYLRISGFLGIAAIVVSIFI
ncbi:hypothetical protein [Cytobacillus gottheilii]|uniref:hypothetical protein n=1 Tax=Cytobacillus gottheilii TaxID=859144 RepID=UPI0009BA9467|nr:hypothetical protein [Cytobacillus gottheilii]